MSSPVQIPRSGIAAVANPTTTQATSASTSPSDVGVGASTSRPSGTDRLGKQEFLKLLITQLKNQDPMKPMEDKEFITQLATFSSLEQLQNLGKQFESFTKAQSIGQAAAMIGKQVEGQLPDGSKTTGPVTQVRFVGGEPRFVVGDREFDLAHIVSVQA